MLIFVRVFCPGIRRNNHTLKNVLLDFPLRLVLELFLNVLKCWEGQNNRDLDALALNSSAIYMLFIFTF